VHTLAEHKREQTVGQLLASSAHCAPVSLLGQIRVFKSFLHLQTRAVLLAVRFVPPDLPALHILIALT